MADWWRSWHGAPTDPKWLAVALRAEVTPLLVSGVAWALFDHASQHEDRGSIEGFDPESYAVWAGADEADVRRVIEAMTAKGMIADGRLVSWEKRQPIREDEGSTERSRALRARRNAVQRDATQCNDRVEERRGDTDTETEAPPAPTRAGARETAEILSHAAWIGDEVESITRQLDHAFALLPEFNAARDGPLLAEKFVHWDAYARNPPANWYRAWLNWLKREGSESGSARRTRTRPADRGGRVDPASQIAGNPRGASAYADSKFGPVEIYP